MKKRTLVFFIFLTIFKISHAQSEIKFKNDSIKQYLDKTLLIIQNNALNKDKLNWDSVRTDIYEKTKDADNIETILPIFPYLFEILKDHHGWLSYGDKNYRWNKESKNLKNQTVKNAVESYKKVYATLLNKNIAYLRIPGNNDFGAKNMDSIANNIVDEIDKINSNKIKGWILDLRINIGGNMYPMIAGISDLIGNDGRLGGFVTSNNQSDGEWFLKKGNIYVDTNQVLNRRKLKKPIKKQIPIAVLISNYTASSGEMTAITLIGRKNTKLFGEESAGYTTTNEGFRLDEKSGVNVAVGYVKDRRGEIYIDNIQPDFVVTGGDNFEDLKSDKKIMKAHKWLKKQSANR